MTTETPDLLAALKRSIDRAREDRRAAADTTRPDGRPGNVARQRGKSYGWSYPAVQRPDGSVVFWRDTETNAGRWIVAPPVLASSFEAGPDWQEHCPHEHGAPWRTCDSEADCIALKREEGAA